MAVEIHRPNIVGPIQLTVDEGLSGQVITSQGPGVAALWTTPAAYSEGTFTPRFSGTGTDGLWAYSIQQGYYTRIGNRVFFNLFLTATSRSVVPSGTAIIRGLPFVSSGSSFNYSAVTLSQISNITLSATITQLVAYVESGVSYIELDQAIGVAPVVTSGLPATSLNTTPIIMVSGHYKAI